MPVDAAERFNDVKIMADNQDELMLLYTARSLYLSDEKAIDKPAELQVIRNIKQNFETAGDNNDITALKKDLFDYKKKLRETGVKDWELKNLETSTCQNIGRLIYSMIYVAGAFTIVA